MAGQIRSKVLRVILSTSLGALLLLSAISMVCIFNMRSGALKDSSQLGARAAQNSQTALEVQVREQIMSLAQDKAALTDEKLNAIQNQTKMVAAMATRIFTNKDQYRPRAIGYLRPDQVRTTTPHLKTPPGVPPSAIPQEAYLAANIIDMLNQITVMDVGINSSYIGGEAGYFITVDKAATDSNRTSFDPRTRSWYRGAKESGGLFWTDIFADAADRGAAITCAMPFYDLSNGGKVFKGVAGSGSAFSYNVHQIIDSTKIGDTGYAFLLNGKGQMMITPKNNDLVTDAQGNIIGEDYLHSDYEGKRELARRMTAGDSGIMELEMDGAAVYVAYHPLSAINWSLGVVAPIDEILDPVRRIEQDILSLTETAGAALNRTILIITLILAALIIAATLITILVAIRLSDSLTAPLVALSAGAEIISAGDLNHKLEVHSADEIGMLAENFNRMIANIRDITGEKERIGAELNVATRIQASMLPCIFPPFPDREEFDIYAQMLPAKEVGGDFYDFFFTAQNKLMLIIADVSGKGVPAALFMVIARTLLKNYAQMGLSLDEVFNTVNRQLCENNDENMFVTVFACILDLTTGVLTFTNAGHNKPLITRAGGDYDFLELKRGLPLGVAEVAPYEAMKLTLDEGDRLYLYTDGVNEAMDKGGEQFGNERFLETANKYKALLPKEFDEAVRRALTDFVNGAERSDDITTLALIFNKMKIN
ncbi:hypothetical protein AGMMS49546_32490 [Spirochaetia bacterium]|nr:hypothetical protein AGMMS49546_32490 [Spirochaetia bacterium]